MRPIYLIQDNPKEVCDFLEFPDLQWEKPATQKVNLHAINLDVPRQIFVDKHISFEAIKTRWQDAAKQENYAYTQGDMTEALAADLIYSHILAPQLEASGMDGNKIQAIKANFIFGYINDKNETCGFAIYYNKENPTQWIIAILKNGDKPYEQRQLSIFFQDVKLPNQKKAQRADLKDIFKTLESKAIEALIRELILPWTASVNTEFTAFTTVNDVSPGQCTCPSVILQRYRQSQKVESSENIAHHIFETEQAKKKTDPNKSSRVKITFDLGF